MGVGGLAFVGLILGELLGGVYILFIQGSYARKLAANGDKPIPEWRLFPAIIGAVAFSIGMLWFVSYSPTQILLLLVSNINVTGWAGPDTLQPSTGWLQWLQEF